MLTRDEVIEIIWETLSKHPKEDGRPLTHRCVDGDILFGGTLPVGEIADAIVAQLR